MDTTDRKGGPVDAAAARPAGRQPIAVRSCLVLGGARSGKSAYAQALAEASGRSPTYLATAAILDDEMRARVAGHREMRDARWRTVEEHLDLAAAIQANALPDAVVLVDCLTLWLSNVMLSGREAGRAAGELVDLIPGLRGPVILVSNEVGSGIVPDNALAREFRDAQGRLNQAVARTCDAVVLVTAGLPTLLKPSLAPPLVVANEVTLQTR